MVKFCILNTINHNSLILREKVIVNCYCYTSRIRETILFSIQFSNVENMSGKDEFDVFSAIEAANSEEDNNVIINYVIEHPDPGTLVDFFLSNGILHHCIEHNKFQLMVDLLKLGKLPLNHQNEEGHTPLVYSLFSHHDFAVKLIEAGADVNIPDSNDDLPLHLVMGVDTKYAELLIEHGATETIDHQNQFGQTPLHCAAQEQDFVNASLLLYHGADANIEDHSGGSPFMESLRHYNHCDHLQELLMENEIDFNRKGHDDHLLQLAIEYKSPFVKEIIKRGADIDNNDVLLWCLGDNIDLFKEFWHEEIFKYNPHCSKILKHTTHYAAKNPVYFQFLELIIDSEELQCALPYLETEGVIKDILSLTEKGYDIELAEKAVYVLLSYGICLDQQDLTYIYNKYRRKDNESDEFFRVLLFMDVNITNENNLIPSIIYSITKNVDDIVEKHIRTTSLCYEDCELVIEWLTRYLVNPKLHQTILDLAVNSSLLRDENLINELRRGFPKLSDLSRNKVRQFINLKWKTKNPCQFYTVVENLPLPSRVKAMIEFRESVY